MFRSEGCTLNPTGRANEESEREGVYFSDKLTSYSWKGHEARIYGKEATKQLDLVSCMFVLFLLSVFVWGTGSLIYKDLVVKEGVEFF